MQPDATSSQQAAAFDHLTTCLTIFGAGGGGWGWARYLGFGLKIKDCRLRIGMGVQDLGKGVQDLGTWVQY